METLIKKPIKRVPARPVAAYAVLSCESCSWCGNPQHLWTDPDGKQWPCIQCGG